MINNRQPAGLASLRPAPYAAGGAVQWGGDQKFDVNPAVVDKLFSQLQAQMQARPQDFRSGEKNAALPVEYLRDMAGNLAASGVSDISEVGKTTVLTNPGEKGIVGDKFFSGSSEVVKKLDDGRMVIERPETEADEGGERQTGRMKQVELSQEEVAKVIEQDGQLILPVYKDRIINKRTGQPLVSEYGERTKLHKGIFGGTYMGDGSTGYGVQFTPDGKPVFFTTGASSSDIADLGPALAVASFIPGVAPFAQALNAAIAADKGDWLSAIASAAGAVPGLDKAAGLGMAKDTLGAIGNISKGASIINAVDKKDWISALGSAANMAGVKQVSVPGFGDMDISSALKGISAVNAAQSGDYIRALTEGLSAAGVQVPDAVTKAAGIAGLTTKPATAGSSPAAQAEGIDALPAAPQAAGAPNIAGVAALLAARQAGAQQTQDKENTDDIRPPVELFSDDIFAGRRGYAGGGMVKKFDDGGSTDDFNYDDMWAQMGEGSAQEEIMGPPDYLAGTGDIGSYGEAGGSPDLGTWQPTSGMSLESIIKSLGGAAKTLLGDGKGGWDLSKLAALGGGIYGLTRDQQDLSNVGYNGGIPQLTAQRAQVPYQNDANRRPGEGGRRYFSDTVYDTPGNSAAAYAKAMQQAQGISQLQRQDGSMYGTLVGGYGTSRPTLNYPGAEKPRDYVAPSVSQQPADMLYKGLTAGSSPQDIARAYAQWSATQGGDTQAARNEAEGYLKNLGVAHGTYQDAYDKYKTKNFAAGGVASLSPLQDYYAQQLINNAATFDRRRGGSDERAAEQASLQKQGQLMQAAGLDKKAMIQMMRQYVQANPGAGASAAARAQQNENFGAGSGGGTPVFKNASQAHQWKLQQARRAASPQDIASSGPVPTPQAPPAMQQGIGSVAPQASQAVPSAPMAPTAPPGANRFAPVRQAWNMAAGGALPPRYLDGDTNGQADEIPAEIEGGTPAALGHGEFVVPADIVSALGGGNSKAGAKELYAMMDRVRQQAHGHTQQMRRVNPAKTLPA